MVVATISLDSEALAWFQWEKGRRPIQNWLQLKSQLLDRFGHTQDGTMCEQFLSLKQEGSVRDYLRAFEQLEMTLEDVPKHIQESTFINGLKPNIQAEVRIMKPKGLREVMKFTQSRGDKLVSAEQSGGSYGGRPSNFNPAPSLYQSRARTSSNSPLPLGRPATTIFDPNTHKPSSTHHHPNTHGTYFSLREAPPTLPLLAFPLPALSPPH